MQVCRLCKETKPLTNYQFRKDNSKYRTECKECLSKKNKQYRQEVKNGKRIPNKPLVVNDKITCSKCNLEQTLDKHSQYKNGIYIKPNVKNVLEQELINIEEKTKNIKRDIINIKENVVKWILIIY